MCTYAQDVLAAYKALCDKKPGSDEKIYALVLSSGSCASVTNAVLRLTEDADNLKVGKQSILIYCFKQGMHRRVQCLL